MTYYDEIAQGYDELHKEEQIEKLRIISEKSQKIDIKPVEKLLDVGCGSGISTRFFNLKEAKRTGIDPSEKLIEIAKSKDPKGNYVVGKAEKLPFEDDSFDCVISLTAIQNFDDIEKGLTEIKRVGKYKFVLSVLKKSSKIEKIKELIKQIFEVKEIIEQKKDLIFLIF